MHLTKPCLSWISRNKILLAVLFLGVVLDFSITRIRDNPWSVLGELIGFVVFLGYIFFPRVGGWVFIAAVVAMNVVPTVEFGLVVYLTIPVIFDWSWRGWWKQSLIATLVSSLAILIGFAGKYNTIASVFYALLLLFALGAGFVLRQYIEENLRLNIHSVMEQHRYELAQLQTKQELSAELHNYTAGTLSRLTTLSAKLLEDAKGSPETSEETRLRLELLHGESVRALSELRRTLSVLGQNPTLKATPTPLATTLDTARDVATGFGFNVEIDTDPENLRTLSTTVTSLLRECVREALTNLIKYGNPEKPCRVSIEVDNMERIVDFTMMNSISSFSANPVLSSGRGLKLLGEQLHISGGFLEAGRTGEHWVLHITIPLEMEVTK